MHRQIAGTLTGPVTKWIVLGFWLVVLVGSGGLAAKLTSVQENEFASFLPGNAESAQVFEEIEAYEGTEGFPDPNQFVTTVVYEKTSGLTDGDLDAIEEQGRQMAEVEGVVDGSLQTPGTARGPVPLASDDGQVALVEVTLDLGEGTDLFERLPESVDQIRGIAELEGGEVYVAGAGGSTADQIEIFSSIDGMLILATLAVVIVILLFTYRSPVLWILPIFSAVVGLSTSMAVLYLLAEADLITVNGQTQGILTVLVIGAGTDYALLLVSRYREELRRHADRHEAMAVALHRAAPAILASAATVAAGMLCLLVADLNSTAGLGPANAVGIVITFAAMVTLLPALLVICGRWIFWPRRPEHDGAGVSYDGLWGRVGRRIAARPRAVWVVTAIILAAACVGLVRLDTGGLSGSEQYTADIESAEGTEVIDARPELTDASNPVLITAPPDQAEAVAQAVARVPGLTEAVPLPPQGGVALLITSIGGSNDPLAASSFDKVDALRDALEGTDAKVGGNSAVFLDVERAAERDNVVIIPLILLVVLLILIALLRALVAPLLLMLTVVLSFGAALGVSTLVFEYVFGFAGVDPGFPLFVFVFLVALGIDYNIFLMTRVREETATRGTRRGSLVALASTGGVITSAGIVLAATFAVLGTLPLVAFAEIGFTVAFGVLLDTMIVRSVLVTALNLDLGGKIWWPSSLDREDRPLEPERPEDLREEPVPV